MPEETGPLQSTIGSDGIPGEIDPFDFLTLLASTGHPEDDALQIFKKICYKSGD